VALALILLVPGSLSAPSTKNQDVESKNLTFIDSVFTVFTVFTSRYFTWQQILFHENLLTEISY
jgi:hypothetical protein